MRMLVRFFRRSILRILGYARYFLGFTLRPLGYTQFFSCLIIRPRTGVCLVLEKYLRSEIVSTRNLRVYWYCPPQCLWFDIVSAWPYITVLVFFRESMQRVLGYTQCSPRLYAATTGWVIMFISRSDSVDLRQTLGLAPNVLLRPMGISIRSNLACVGWPYYC